MGQKRSKNGAKRHRDDDRENEETVNQSVTQTDNRTRRNSGTESGTWWATASSLGLGGYTDPTRYARVGSVN